MHHGITHQKNIVLVKEHFIDKEELLKGYKKFEVGNSENFNDFYFLSIQNI